MKKWYLIIVMVMSGMTVFPVPVSGVSPETPGGIKEYIFSCDFQDVNLIRESFVVYDLDGLQPTAFMKSLGFVPGVPWVADLRDSYESDNFYAGSTSCYDPPGRADDWLVTRAIEVPAPGYILRWKSQSFYPLRRDGLKVFISTIGNRPENFTAIPVFEVEEEESGPTENADGEWTAHEVALDAYTGKTVYIAFVNQSTDKGIIFLDDVSVRYKGRIALENTTPAVTTREAGATVTGKLIVTGDKPVDSYRICYQGKDEVVHTRVYEHLALQPGEVHEFGFEEGMLLETGQQNPYRLWAVIDDEPQVELEGSVLCLSFIPERKVVLEKGTGEWCGNCPLGILAIEELEKLYPDRFIPIAIHNGDPYAMNAYLSTLGILTFPSGQINRKYSGSPMTRDFEFTGEETFYTLTEKALNEFTFAGMRVTGRYTEGNNLHITLRTEITFGADIENGDYRILYVILEDDLPGWQYNYFSSVVHPNLGEWGKGGQYGSSRVHVLFRDVARACIGDYTGTPGLLPSSVKAGDPVVIPAAFDLPDIVSDPDNVSVVVMLIEGTTGEIVNADKIHLKRETAIKDSRSAEPVEIGYTGDAVVISGIREEASGCLYSPDGTLITACEWPDAVVPKMLPVRGYRGTAILRLQTAEKVIVRKIVL